MSPRTSAEVLEPTQRTRMVLRPGAPGAPLQGVPQHSFFILSPSPPPKILSGHSHQLAEKAPGRRTGLWPQFGA